MTRRWYNLAVILLMILSGPIFMVVAVYVGVDAGDAAAMGIFVEMLALFFGMIVLIEGDGS